MGRVCVSSCRCCVFVSVVHPVAILSAVFCVICSLLMFVSDASGDHMVETYSSMGLVMALYVAMIVSFALAMFMLLCVDIMVMSSAYVVSFNGTCGDGVSDVCMLKSVGDSTPPCGTPFLNWRCVDVLFLNVVYALRPLM